MLGVLVVLTAITLPGILRWQRALPMERAVSLLQLQLQETRAAAVRSGEEWYLILPHANVPGRREPAATDHARNQPHAFVLPEGVRCEIIEINETSDSQPELQTQITFHPDGTVRACRIRVTTNDGIVTILQIHRMTGMATIVQLQERERTQNAVPEAIASQWTQRRGTIS